MRSTSADRNGLRRVEGMVNSFGGVAQGVGFMAEKPGTGVYRVRFAPPFKAPPIVTATASNPGTGVFARIAGGAVTTSEANIGIVNDAGAGFDTTFYFVAEGLA